MKGKRFLQLFGAITVAITLLPFIATDYWWVRVFDFPHLVLTFLTLTALTAYLVRFGLKQRNDYLFAGLLVASLAIQFSKILPYTPLGRYEVLNSTVSDESQTFSVYLANVLQKNENKAGLGAAIQSIDADILLFTETDHVWQAGIADAIRDDYRYAAEMPLSNTYGMLLYSRLPLIDPQVKFIIDDSIPSIHSLVRLPSGDTVQLYAIHPTPPMPQHNPTSTDRDAEMMKIALLTKDSKYPVIVLGDFNDVAWSPSTRHFLEVSGLLDPRKGRGFYNTYHAKYFFFRWPLDHIFVSEHFRIVSMGRGSSIQSDHFPVVIRMSFEPEQAVAQRKAPPSQKEIDKAHEQIAAEKEAEQ